MAETVIPRLASSRPMVRVARPKPPYLSQAKISTATRQICTDALRVWPGGRVDDRGMYTARSNLAAGCAPVHDERRVGCHRKLQESHTHRQFFRRRIMLSRAFAFQRAYRSSLTSLSLLPEC